MPEQRAHSRWSEAENGPAVWRHSPNSLLFTRNHTKKVNVFATEAKLFTFGVKGAMLRTAKAFSTGSERGDIWGMQSASIAMCEKSHRQMNRN